MGRFERITIVRETGSTNEDMSPILGEERSRGLTLVADYQHRGLGRKGRSWLAAPGTALLCTIALPDPLKAAQLWSVPFWIALALHRALEDIGIHALLQWPNDVLIDGRKVAGILCISRVTGDRAWAACGIGVNVRRPTDEGTLALVQPAPAFISDYAESDRDNVLHALLAHADALYEILDDPPQIIERWNSAANLPGARYRIAIDGEHAAFDATALRLVEGGALLVDDGEREREISLADARVLRE